MERADRSRLIALPGAYSSRPLVAPGPLELDEETAHHLRVRRLEVGAELRVTDGLGVLGQGAITAIRKRGATMEVAALYHEPSAAPVRLLVPVADRDRMLWLAEKSAELGLQRWSPVRWARSRSVSPRGEGEPFRARVRARMIAALVQSGGAWLASIDPDQDGGSPHDTKEFGERGLKLLLDAGGEAMISVLASSAIASAAGDGTAPVTVALGPEGGLTDDERTVLLSAGFRPCALGTRVLRFETAAIAALVLLDAVSASAAAHSQARRQA